MKQKIIIHYLLFNPKKFFELFSQRDNYSRRNLLTIVAVILVLLIAENIFTSYMSADKPDLPRLLVFIAGYIAGNFTSFGFRTYFIHHILISNKYNVAMTRIAFIVAFSFIPAVVLNFLSLLFDIHSFNSIAIPLWSIVIIVLGIRREVDIPYIKAIVLTGTIYIMQGLITQIFKGVSL